MHLTSTSNYLINYFLKAGRNCVVHKDNVTEMGSQWLLLLYYQIDTAYDCFKNHQNEIVLETDINDITNASQIPRPTSFPSDGFPREIKRHIDNHSIISVTYYCRLFDNDVTFEFLIDDGDSLILKEKTRLDSYVETMLVWLTFLHMQLPKSACVQKPLRVFLYLTILTKYIPRSAETVLDEIHVNTAFTMTCPANVAEIVIFRKEEWFKVFIHETFHNFAVDFSGANSSSGCDEFILKLFHVRNADVRLYEAYTETWARLMNIIFCAYKHTRTAKTFLTKAKSLILLEQTFSVYQTVKVLRHMKGMTYQDLIGESDNSSNNHFSTNKSKRLYNENTSVLSYFVITMILLNNYEVFLSWCSGNNKKDKSHLIVFPKTSNGQISFCNLIKSLYKSPSLLKTIKCVETHLSSNKTINEFMNRNLRMTACEMG